MPPRAHISLRLRRPRLYGSESTVLSRPISVKIYSLANPPPARGAIGHTEHVLSWLANVIKIPELRHRLYFTAFILFLYRLGSWMPAPGVKQSQIENYFNHSSGTVFSLLNMFSGSSLSRFSVFALGIMPYITASIILQLMTTAIPRLEALQKEGESGYAKINQYTRYLTIVLSMAQAVGYSYLFHREHIFSASIGNYVIIVLVLTVGATTLMWMGELITKYGVGNGISLLIFASILSYMPSAITAWINGSAMERLSFPIVALAVVVAVVFFQEGQRKIPVTYAKRVIGRQTLSGSSTYLPLRVNMAGVIPDIFAAAILAFPPTIGQFFPATNHFITTHFQYSSWTYVIAEALLIIVFTYSYTAVQFNPKDQADNLRKQGGYVPGIRPGLPTASYLDGILTRLTFFGALFLAVVAVLPQLLIKYAGFSQATSRALGGTSILIVVGVALDTVRGLLAVVFSILAIDAEAGEVAAERAEFRKPARVAEACFGVA